MNGIDSVLEAMVPGSSESSPPKSTRKAIARSQVAPASDAAPIVSRYQLMTADDLRAIERPEWVIKSILPSRGIATLYGASGSGKSFLLIAMMACLAEGEAWFGNIVPKARRVVAVILEGEAGIKNRIAAWEASTGGMYPPSVRFVFGRFSLLSQDDVMTLIGAIDEVGGADVVVIDTLNRAMPGGDENSSRDMSLMLESVKELQSLLESLVILVHHTGKDESKGMRGHSSLQGAIDVGIRVGRVDGQRQWTLDKNKEGADGTSFPFTLEVVDIGEDEDGVPVTSCFARPSDGHAVMLRKMPKGGNQRVIYDALAPLFRASSAWGKADAPASRPCLRLDYAIEKSKGSLVVEPKRQAERARLAIQGMAAAGILGHAEGWIWLK